VDSKSYEMWMNTNLKTRFWGKSLDIKPLGGVHIKFKDNEDHYICVRPTTSAQNIIIGTMYIDHSGDCIIDNITTGDKAEISFKALGIFTSKSKRGIVGGKIKNSDGEEVYEIYGKWTEALYYKPAGAKDEEGIKIWEFPEQSQNWEQLYYFTEFGLQLNMITDKMRKHLPPTDSRLRTDQR